jgi:hypothetical protein
MIFERQLAVGLLDLVAGGGSINAQDLIVIPLVLSRGHGKGVKDLTFTAGSGDKGSQQLDDIVALTGGTKWWSALMLL